MPNPEINWTAAISAARQAVELVPDTEACGYILNNEVLICLNTSDKPGTFSLSEWDCVQVYGAMEFNELGGVWHSHPCGHREPSFQDWENHPRGVPMYIVVLVDHQDSIVLRFDEKDRPNAKHQGAEAYDSTKPPFPGPDDSW